MAEVEEATNGNVTKSATTRRQEVSVVVPINIALIKYWGKRDEELMLPLNDSVSLTIDDLYARTTIRIGDAIRTDSLTINGEVIDLNKSNRFTKCFTEVRRLIRKRTAKDDGDTNEEANKTNYFDKFEITSETNFPIECGLASSAAGLAAIAFALGSIYRLSEEQIVRIARLGSGSACRSVLGGFVHWKAGREADGRDCTCTTIAPVEKWNKLCALILVLSHMPKRASSRNGMQKSVETSELLTYRASHVVPKRVIRLKKAIESNDFDEFATVIMLESNQLHAICMDTMPPLQYLNENSWHIIRLIDQLNSAYDHKRCAYSFDAGPNCCIFVETDFLPTLIAAIHKYCLAASDTLIDKVFTSALGKQLPDMKSAVEKSKETLHMSDIERKAIVEDLFLSHVGAPPRIVQ